MNKRGIVITLFLITSPFTLGMEQQKTLTSSGSWKKEFFYVSHTEMIIQNPINSPKTLKNLVLQKIAFELLSFTKKGNSLLAFTNLALHLPADLLNELATMNICINQESNERTTLFLSAICQQNEQLVTLLLEPPWSANVNKTCCSIRHLPLHKAITIRNLDIIQLLLSHNAHLTPLGKNQATVLHLATRLGDIQIIKLLLGYGADRTAQTRNNDCAYELANKSPHLYATTDEHKEILSLLNPQTAISEDQKAAWRAQKF